MPRLDNSSAVVVWVYNLEFNGCDPGSTPPIDLCTECWAPWLDTELEIEHPDYQDDKYYCRECAALLTADDNIY